MLIEGNAVRMAGHAGRVRRFAHAAHGRRWWHVDWEDGTSTVVDEKWLIDVDREEMLEAMDTVIPLSETCEGYYYGRCHLRAGHRTLRHWCAGISWTDEMAAHFAATGRPYTGLSSS